jgi:hypothetical protein
MLFLFVNEPCGSMMKRMPLARFAGDVQNCQNWQIKTGHTFQCDRMNFTPP